MCGLLTVYLLRDLEPDREFDLLRFRSLEPDFRLLRYLSFAWSFLLRDRLRDDERERERSLRDLERERERDRERDFDLDLDRVRDLE